MTTAIILNYRKKNIYCFHVRLQDKSVALARAGGELWW